MSNVYMLSVDCCFGLNKMHMRFITLTVFFRSSFLPSHFLNGSNKINVFFKLYAHVSANL
jgi:hypothetical protein